MLAGLYSGRMPGWAVLLAGGAGIIIGALFYPRPDLITPWALTAPFGGQMFFAFAAALLVSTAIAAAVICAMWLAAPSRRYDFSILNSRVRPIDEPATGGAD